MNKKIKTLLFILGATVFNIITTAVCFVILLVFYSRVLFSRLPEAVTAWMMPAFFIISIVVSFLVYRFAVKIMTKKVDMEKHFDPIFGRRKK